ncbi:MAG TPA: hypothetical protein VFX76_12740 [Roseiflexaceae bacterium]|nr:hypothetical protein [Roseiflexaceae bacterium]
MTLGPPIHELIERIHDSTHKLVLEFAGAASQALFWLHAVPGSSRTILEATDRYVAQSLADLLGGAPAQTVSRDTAIAMAMAAYRRAMRLTDGAETGFGIGCTAALVTDRERRGANRCWIATCDRAIVRVYNLEMSKGARDRAAEEQLVSLLLLHAIAQASGLEGGVPLPLLEGEHVLSETLAELDPIALLLAGQANSVLIEADGRRAADAPVDGVLLSGSFNPLHPGHEELVYAAAELLHAPAGFELPIVNADKPPLSYAEIERRLDQFAGRYRVVLSREPLFVGKAKLFPGCAFAIGYDTAVRLVDPRYYGGPSERDAALAAIRAQGCRFVVAGRLEDGVFRTLNEIAVPPGFEDLFVELPESMFRSDLSSTAIRTWRAR